MIRAAVAGGGPPALGKGRERALGSALGRIEVLVATLALAVMAVLPLA